MIDNTNFSHIPIKLIWLTNRLIGTILAARNDDIGLLFKTSMSHRNFSGNRIDRVFTNPADAVAYYDFLLLNGYLKSDIDVLMPQEIWEQYFTGKNSESAGTIINKKDMAATEEYSSGARSGIAASIVHPTLGLAIAGPVAGTIANSAGIYGKLLNTLVHAGLSAAAAEAYEKALKSGSIIVSAEARDQDGILPDPPFGANLRIP